eukprot:TRINITY_DN32030_c0_g1_i1.p1 TRINITY_DN32030_c0_g1~~TRINITY_DN32030_c0_g1_i1.p1  ORF type:complete len:367 (+),score=28.41 TRINITY_DN32030_c0_g1_i1:58-1101(+)
MKSSVCAGKPMAVPRPLTFIGYATIIGVIVGLHLAVKKYRLLPTVLMVSLGVQIGSVIGVPTFVLVMRWRSSKKPVERSLNRDPVKFSWLPNPITSASFVALGGMVWLLQKMLDEIYIWKLAVALQTLSYTPLLLKTLASKTVSNISVKKLALDACCLACRLAATHMLGMRLPRRSGQTSVMVADALALTFVVVLLMSILGWRRAGYQSNADNFGVALPMFFIIGLAALFRVTFSVRFIPDFLWTLAVYVDVFAMLPQLRMIGQNGGVADEAVSHHVAGTFVSRLLGVTFWWLIRGTWHHGVRLSGWIILVAYSSQLLLLSHFMAYYLKAVVGRGLFSCGPLVCAEM